MHMADKDPSTEEAPRPSLGGLLGYGDKFSQIPVSDTRELPVSCCADDTNPIARRDRAAPPHSFSCLVANTYVGCEVSNRGPEIDDIGVGHVQKGTYHTLNVKHHRYDLYLKNGYDL